MHAYLKRHFKIMMAGIKNVHQWYRNLTVGKESKLSNAKRLRKQNKTKKIFFKVQHRMLKNVIFFKKAW